ncbi:MAG: hypothetical protein KAJ43_09460, partial [Gemmatimonadetes bacterium]|nr:hypothetical protein [Gemmatimonadota bacterium]
HRRNSGQPEGRRFARWRDSGGASYSWTGRWKVLAAGPGPVDRFALEAVDDARLAAFRGDPGSGGQVSTGLCLTPVTPDILCDALIW